MKWFKLNNRFLTEGVVIAIAFLIPFMPKLLNIFIGVFALLVIADANFRGGIRTVFSNRISIVCILFYLFYVIGIIWSTNMKYAWLDLQIKFSIFVFPLLLAGVGNQTGLNLKKISIGFILGCMSALIICLTRATINYPITGMEGYFYQSLSFFIHPGYFAMYLNYAICFLIHEIVFTDKSNYGKWSLFLFPVAVFLIAGLLLLSSKAGILILLLTLLTTVVFLIIKKRPWKILISLILILAGALMFTVSSSVISKRWNEMSHTFSGSLEETEGHTTGQRLKTWEGATKLIMEKPWLGVGTGDVKDELVKKYEELHLEEPALMRLNAHNQFLQTTIALGIVGVVILLLLFYNSFISFVKSRNFLALSFLVIVVFNAMIESILEVQAGVIFFAFFLGVFTWIPKDKNVAVPG